MTQALPPEPDQGWPKEPAWFQSFLRVLPRYVVLFAAVLFALVFASLQLRNHRAFGSLAYDTAIYDQAIWLMGRTINPFMTVRGLYVHGHHVNPFLLLLVPISWLGGRAEAFLLAQTFTFALGAIPVFGLTRYLLDGAPKHETQRSGALRWLRATSSASGEWIAAGVAVAYLGSPVIQWINWAHFHPESFATLPFLCAWWAMLRRRWGWFALCVAVLVSTREETALAVAMMGVVLLWRTFTLRRGLAYRTRTPAGRPAFVHEASSPGQTIIDSTEQKPGLFVRIVSRGFRAPDDLIRRDVDDDQGVTSQVGFNSKGGVPWLATRTAYLPGILTSLIGGGWYLLCTRIFLPRFNNGRPPYYLKSFFGSLGGSVGGILKTFVTDPSKIINLATKQDRLDYYWALGRPVGFVFLFSPAQLLMAAPSMLSNVLTDSPYPRLIEYQYAAVLAGPLWIATICSLAKLRRHRRALGFALVGILGLTVYADRDFSPAPISKRGEIYWAAPDARSESLAEAVRLIPPNAGVAASDFVLPHLSGRKHAYLWPNPFQERFWGNYDPIEPTPLPDPNNVDWFVIDDRLLQPGDADVAAELTGEAGAFQVVFRANGVLVAKRKPGMLSPLNRREVSRITDPAGASG